MLIQKSKNVKKKKKKKYETQNENFLADDEIVGIPQRFSVDGWLVFPCNYRRRSIYNKEVFL